MESDKAKNLGRRASELKIPGDYSGVMRLRLELEQLHDRLGSDVDEKTRNLNLLAHAAVHAGHLQEAERAARKCFQLYRPIATERDERWATYVMMLAAVLAENKNFDEAVTCGKYAVSIFAQNHGATNSFVADRMRDVERMLNRAAGPYLDR